jgi:peptide/nickel transport system substrate-binding protein
MIRFALALVLLLVATACEGGNKAGNALETSTVQKGGVYRTAVTDFQFTNGFDPTGEYTVSAWAMYGATTRTLVNYKHIAGPQGNKLYPDLATSVPAPTENGLTYTFKLKPGIRFGPPVSRAITSKDVAYAFQRINTASLVAQYGFYYYGVIKGMDGKAKSADQKISGIDTLDNQTIVFHLTKPTGDLLYRLAMPAAAPIPQEVAKCFTKAGDYGRYVISSGSYMIQGSDKLDISSCKAMKPITGFDPSKKLHLVRNPAYDQATDNLRSNYIDGIKIDINTNLDDIFNKVEVGALDGSLGTEPPPKTTLRRYLTEQSKKHYLHSNAHDGITYLAMNTVVPPFDDIHVRKAANLIMDKAAILQAWGGQTAGDIATHILPPTVLNEHLRRDYDPFASPGYRGDVAKAQAEIRLSKYDSDKDGTCDQAACSNLTMININQTPWTNMEPVVVQSFAKIGINVKVRELAIGSAFSTLQTVANHIPLGHAGWAKDYADPYTFIGPLFAGSSIIPTGNSNYSLVGLTKRQASELKVPYPAGGVQSIDADLQKCQRIPSTQADARLGCWADLDRKLMEQVVPWIPYLWDKALIVTAPSVTRYEFDQFSVAISLTQLAVNNKATIN